MKTRLFVILCFLSLLILCANHSAERNVKYPSGKDTIESFGDGTYQISSGSSNSLHNEKYGNCMIQNVENFHIADKKVYVIGSTDQSAVVDGTEVKRNYIIYSAIHLDNNFMELFCIPSNPLYPSVFIAGLDEMIENRDVLLLSSLSEFSDEDLSVFNELKSVP